jgi:hypothetical protein
MCSRDARWPKPRVPSRCRSLREAKLALWRISAVCNGGDVNACVGCAGAFMDGLT